MCNINFKLIYIDDIMSLMWETMLWYGLDPSGFLQELIKNYMHVVPGLSNFTVRNILLAFWKWDEIE